MNYNELNEKIDNLKFLNDTTYKQISIMFIPLYKNYILEEENKEIPVQYDIRQVVQEFLYKEKKVVFFIDKFLKTYKLILEIDKILFLKKDIFLPRNYYYDELTYYFDSFIASFSTIIEPDQKEQLLHYINSKEIEEFYPNRNKFGLYWQIYMLRNRIMHYTNWRYSYEKKVCYCYENFSSEVKCIKTDSEGNINILSTLIDIYKNKLIEDAINISISDKTKNPFDLLFPNISAKGYSKNKPFVLHISNDIFFDYTNSAINLLEEIEQVLNKINNLFLDSLTQDYYNIEKLKKSKTTIIIDEKEISYSIEDVFDICKK